MNDWRKLAMDYYRIDHPEGYLTPSIGGGRPMSDKTGRAVSAIGVEDIPDINSILAKQDTVNLIPGPGGSVKIIHIKRKIVKTTQGNGCVKCGKEQKT